MTGITDDQLQSFLHQLTDQYEKIRQLIQNQTELLEKLPNIAFKDLKETGQDDLIDRFQNLLDELDLDVDLSKCVDENDVKNKATYFYRNRDKITNERAYLSKVISQICLTSDLRQETSEEKRQKELTPEYAEELLYLFEGLSADQIEQIRFEYEHIHWLIGGKERKNYTKFDKIMVTQKAVEKGIIQKGSRVQNLIQD